MNRQINHKTMRVIIGVIALGLAPIVFLLSNSESLNSISASYWTNSGDIFVGSVLVVGFFLSAYNGTGNGRDLEYYLSRLSCVFAIGVALFPTNVKGDGDIPPLWTQYVSSIFGVEPAHIHYTSAVLLFICLTVMMWFFSNRAMGKGKPLRSYFYRIIAVSMFVGMVALYFFGKYLQLEYTILLVEAWGLALFGLGWLVAGTYKTEPDSGSYSRI